MNSFRNRNRDTHVIFLILFSFTFLVNYVQSIIGTIAVEDDKEFPFQVLISRDSYFECSGTILDKRTILTVAKCFFDTKEKHYKDFKIIAGTAHYEFHKKPVVKEHMQIVQIKKVTIHQCYNFKRTEEEDKKSKSPKDLYDLALVKLSSDLKFDEYVSDIKINKEPPIIASGPEPSPEENCKEGDICVPEHLKEGTRTYSGLGTLIFKLEQSPEKFKFLGNFRDVDAYPKLQKALVNFEDVEECLASLVSKNKTRFEESLKEKDMICVKFQEEKTAAASGDLGGQLLVQNDGKYELVGLYFHMSGVTGLQMFTHVGKYTDWLEDPEKPLPCAVLTTTEPAEEGDTTEEENNSGNRLVGDIKILIPIFLHLLLKMT